MIIIMKIMMIMMIMNMTMIMMKKIMIQIINGSDTELRYPN